MVSLMETIDTIVSVLIALIWARAAMSVLKVNKRGVSCVLTEQ